MTIENFEKVKKACWDVAEVTVHGCRNQKAEANQMLINLIRSKCWKRYSNSKYVVFITRQNLGNKKWPDAINVCEVAYLGDFRETENCFVSEHLRRRISKSNVIGWLS